MHLSVHKSALLQAMQTVSKAVAVRTPKPVLTGILLEAKENSILATAYDLELGIQIEIDASEDNHLQVFQKGSIVLPARYFSEVIRKLPDSLIHMQVSQNYMTEISTQTVQFHLHGIDAEEFPKLPSFVGAKGLHFNAPTLSELIRTTAFATANTEVRPILTGIDMHCENDSVRFTATDGLRLATKQTILEQSSDWHAVIPGKSLTELTKILQSAESTVDFYLTASHSLFVIGQTRFYTRLIEGTYPDTSRIIPTSYRTETTVSGSDLLSAIDRAALIARDKDNHQVRAEITDNLITVSSSSPEIGNVSETVSIQQKTGEDIQIAFNARYVIDALRALDLETVKIRFNGSTQAFIIEKVDDSSILQLISPVLWR